MGAPTNNGDIVVEFNGVPPNNPGRGEEEVEGASEVVVFGAFPPNSPGSGVEEEELVVVETGCSRSTKQSRKKWHYISIRR